MRSEMGFEVPLCRLADEDVTDDRRADPDDQSLR
jgi:hypothetical protein